MYILFSKQVKKKTNSIFVSIFYLIIVQIDFFKKAEVERGYTQKYQVMTTKVAISENIDSKIIGSF